MSASRDLAARAKKVKREPASDTPPPADKPEGKPSRAKKAAAKSTRTRPVRLSVDLAPQVYKELTTTLPRLAEQTNAVRVSQVEVMRILVDLLLTNADVRDHVVAELKAEHG